MAVISADLFDSPGPASWLRLGGEDMAVAQGGSGVEGAVAAGSLVLVVVLVLVPGMFSSSCGLSKAQTHLTAAASTSPHSSAPSCSFKTAWRPTDRIAAVTVSSVRQGEGRGGSSRLPSALCSAYRGKVEKQRHQDEARNNLELAI